MSDSCTYLNEIIKFPMKLVHFITHINNCHTQKSHSLKSHVIIKAMGLHAVDKNLMQVDDEKQFYCSGLIWIKNALMDVIA